MVLLRVDVEASQRTVTIEGRITVWLVSSLTGLPLTKQENMLIFVGTETTESKPVKLDNGCTVKHAPTIVSVLWVV